MALANQIGISSKCVSERHAKAEQAGKLTAGEANKLMKKAGIKTTAKAIVEMFELLNGYEAEWHHSGFYKGNNGRSTMGRTFFFESEQIQILIENWESLIEKQQKIKAEEEARILKQKNTQVQGVYYQWAQSWGEKKKHKRLEIYKGSEYGKPENLILLSDDEMLCAELMQGKKYYGWDEPLKSEFSKENYDIIIAKRVAI